MHLQKAFPIVCVFGLCHFSFVTYFFSVTLFRDKNYFKNMFSLGGGKRRNGSAGLGGREATQYSQDSRLPLATVLFPLDRETPGFLRLMLDLRS